VGLVLDADDTAGKRVADRVALLQRKFPEIGVPTLFPAAGWINVAHSPRCGVWFMPDNQRDGALEAFIAPFIPAGDSSIAYAEQCARDARTAHGAPYEAKDASKARLHTWLAWRAEPGRPYGRAIAAGDLAPLRDATAQSFADWFEALFIR
jgi:hypothetical protein